MPSRNADSPPPAGEPRGPSGYRDDKLLGRCIDGKYVLREVIGVGPSGRVYRADQVALDRPVAVKVMHPVRGGQRQLAQRFHDEAFAVSRLHHPNVVSVYDYGRTGDGLLYVAMEYLQGRRLSSLLIDEFPLPPERVVTIMIQVLDALEEAHSAGVIHADLKSDNVIVEPLRGGRTLVKVLDFGIAHLFHDSSDEPASSIADSFSKLLDGTPEYVAPEVMAGIRPDREADIYSAGVVLYELVTGSLPFSGQAAFAGEGIGQRDAPGQLGDTVVTLEAELERIALRALAREPDERFSDVGSFRRALQALVDDGPDVLECSSCSYRNEPEFRFCAQCGARLVAANPTDEAAREIEHAKKLAQLALERGELTEAKETLRGAVGLAIRVGNVSLIISAYCGLAAILGRAGSTHEAIGEVEEALDLVTVGGTGTDLDASAELWRLQVQLADLYHQSGRHREALSIGSQALHTARKASSTEGRKAAQALMARLYSSARRSSPQPVEKLATSEDSSPEIRLFASRRSLDQVLSENETAPWQLLDASDLDLDD